MNDLNEMTLRDSLTSTEDEHGAESVRTAFCLLELGDFLELADRFAEAELCYFRAADIYRILDVDHHLLEAIALKSAAEMLKIQGLTDKASVIKKQVREIVLRFTELGIA